MSVDSTSENQIQELITSYFNYKAREVEINTADSVNRRVSTFSKINTDFQDFEKFARDPKNNLSEIVPDFDKFPVLKEKANELLKKNEIFQSFKSLHVKYTTAIHNDRDARYKKQGAYIATPVEGTGFFRKLFNAITMPIKKRYQQFSINRLGKSLKYDSEKFDREKSDFLVRLESTVKNHGIFSEEYAKVLQEEKIRLEAALKSKEKTLDTSIAPEQFGGDTVSFVTGQSQINNRMLLSEIDRSIENYNNQVQAVKVVSSLSDLPELLPLDDTPNVKKTSSERKSRHDQNGLDHEAADNGPESTDGIEVEPVLTIEETGDSNTKKSRSGKKKY